MLFRSDDPDRVSHVGADFPRKSRKAQPSDPVATAQINGEGLVGLAPHGPAAAGEKEIVGRGAQEIGPHHRAKLAPQSEG